MFGAPAGGTTRGGHHGVDCAALRLIVPPNGRSGGGSTSPTIVRVAEGYYADVQPLIPAKTQKVEAQAAAAVKVICGAPPQNIQQAFADLSNAWAAIQAATTVPGT